MAGGLLCSGKSIKIRSFQYVIICSLYWQRINIVKQYVGVNINNFTSTMFEAKVLYAFYYQR